MPTLIEKINQLKCDVVTAARLAEFWDKQVATYGELKAEQFYLSLGLNHIERKSVEWEGLKLSREPKEHEKIAVKGIANAQESSKEAIGKILLSLREDLISDGLKRIKKLDPASYHELILKASKESRTELRDRLVKVHRQGRMLVAAELGKKSASISNAPHRCHFTDGGLMTACTCGTKEAVPDDEFDELDTLTDLTNSRVVNDVQSRIIAAAQRYRLLGLTGPEFINAVQGEITAGSVSYIDRTATGVANRVINIGRGDEAQSRRDQWGRVEYSALLDQNVCGPCASEDGQEAAGEDELQPVPNPECEGGDWCRCFHVFVQD